MADKPELKIEYVPIEQVRLDKSNPRKNDETVEQVKTSMQKFGVRWPILVRRSNSMIIAGHTRYKAMKELGDKKVPVLFWDADEVDAKVFSVFDNKSTENSQWDFSLLAEHFVWFDEQNVDMKLTGFSAEEIAGYMDGGSGFIPDNDPQPGEDRMITCPNCNHEFKVE